MSHGDVTGVSPAERPPDWEGDELALPPGRLQGLARHWSGGWTSRLLAAVGTLVGVAVLVFIALRVVPGDEVTASLGTSAGLLSPEQRAALEHYYGMDKSLPQQFIAWIDSVLSGNLGYSAKTGESATAMIARGLPVTLELAFLSALIGSVLGVALGVLASSKPRGLRDAIGQGFGLLGLAIPVFVLGAFVVSVFASHFGYFPNGKEYARPTEDLWLNLQQMMFPSLVLAVGFAAIVMRTTRTAMLEVGRNDFVRTARGKGLSKLRVEVVHVLRNALIPIVTIIGIQFGYLLGGAIIVEQIFALPGLGRLLIVAIDDREYAVVQSTVLVMAAAFVLVNLATDLVYAKIDPRVRAR